MAEPESFVRPPPPAHLGDLPERVVIITKTGGRIWQGKVAATQDLRGSDGGRIWLFIAEDGE